MAVWTDPGFMARVVEKLGQPIGSAHNGFLEVLLGSGAIGAIALVVVVVLLVRSAVSAAAAGGELAVLPLALLAYALVANLTESFIGANVLPWALAVAAGYMVRNDLPSVPDCDDV